MKKYLLVLFANLLFVAGTAIGQSTPEDQSAAPYFFVQSDAPDLDHLPLKSSTAEVNIAGVIADVVITQTYRNEGGRPLEAIYVFPGSTRAAVYGMEMRIGERTIIAEIREKEQAREEYEAAKEEGKRASLLEQERPNVFQMNVANIMPGDEIQVVLRYTELLIPEEGVYSFVYPTVVGPRYTGESTTTASTQNNFTATPYLHEGEMAPYDFDLAVNINAGLPIQEVGSITHQLDLTFPNAHAAEIRLPEEQKAAAGNRDFVLNYRLSGGQIESGLVLYEHEDENFFLLMVQPPKRVEVDEIPPREYVFVVDVSGSMHGFPLNVAKQLMRDLLVGLRPVDQFNVMLFSGGSQVLASESLHCTPENIERGLTFVENASGGGGTNLLSALNRALELPRCTEDISRSFVVVTDGYVSVEQETYELIRNKLDEANLFAFGIGSSVNRYIIEGMAHVGMSEPLIVLNQQDANEKADQFREYIAAPVLTRVKVDFGSFEVYDVEPPTIPDVLAERPVIIYGKYNGTPQGTIKLTGHTGGGKYKARFAVEEVQPEARNAAIRYLWARERIRLLDDYGQLSYSGDFSEEVTALGLTYNLMTAYTSFIAVDNVPVAEGEDAETVQQPIPLPQGVSDYAIGFDLGIEGVTSFMDSVQATPEKVIVIGSLDARVDLLIQAQLKAWLIGQFATLKECMDLPEGTFELVIRLDGSGQLVAYEVANKELTQQEEHCLDEHLLTWQYPADLPATGLEVSVQITIAQ
jgi:Ca-activated chloride channel family protein